MHRHRTPENQAIDTTTMFSGNTSSTFNTQWNAQWWNMLGAVPAPPVLAKSRTKAHFFIHYNVKKTKVKVMKTQNEKETIPITIKADDIKLEQVDRFLYLGQLITADGKCREEAIRRIGIAKSTFNKMDNIFKDRHLSMATKLRTLRCYVISTLLYASDTWTMTAEMEKRIESLELWFLRRIMKVSWTKKISNVKIRELIEQKGGRQLYLIKEIRKRKVEYCGHIMRKDGITKLTITGKGEGKKGPGRPRRTWLKDIQEWCTYPSNVALIREAENRQRWTKWLYTTPWMRDVT